MPTTRNIKGGYPSNISQSGTSPMNTASSSQSHSPQTNSNSSARWESTAESPNDSESLPPRMRLKEKKKPFGEFRIIRESASINDHATELKPIPSPPWANDSFSLDSSRLHDDTRGKAMSHARPSFSSASFRYQERCGTHSRNNSKSSTDCSTTGGLQALSISTAHTWSPPQSLDSSSLSTSTSPAGLSRLPTSPHQTDDISSDAGPSLGIAYQLRPHRTIKPPIKSAQMHAVEERAQSVPDEDEEDMAMATAALKQLQHSSMSEANSFPPPARPSRKQKRYACDVCGQIFTRSGDVRRHKESRHDNSEGCRCPFCDRVLTRQDALQRHWDKYCRKKSKRYLEKQPAESQTRTIPSTSSPVYGPGAPSQTTSTTTTTTTNNTKGFGTLDQSQINYRYLNIFG